MNQVKSMYMDSDIETMEDYEMCDPDDYYIRDEPYESYGIEGDNELPF